tara:strand:+ start:202 stop:552 length:351 start_codon:yes stop_codon:yes gene_type:complete
MAKKKIKKFLKNVAPLAIAGLGAAMLGRGMGRKGRAFTNAEARRLMTSNPAMRGSMIPMNARQLDEQLMMLNEGTDFGLGPMDGAKDGGRITKSGVKRKVSKFAKKKKQANRSKKK